MNHRTRKNIRRLPLALAIVAGLQVPAFAQEQTDAQEDKPQKTTETERSEKAKTLDTVTVTGSLLRKPEYETTSPVQVISIEKGIAAGQFDTADLLMSSSSVASSTQINNQFGGFVVEGGTGVQTVSLRGLGANRTLVLLDGQRPGPAGTRGQVGAFDLNVIPQAILQRIEIVNDGASSIYGSDAVAGVVNLITRKSIDAPQFTYSMSIPEAGGGEQFSASIANGWNFDNGSIIAAAQWDKLDALTFGDRDFFKCSEDRIRGIDGRRIDRQDRSIIGDTNLGGCNNLYANTILDYFSPSTRYVPSPDGSTVGPFPGYRPRPIPTQNYENSPQAYYEDVLNYSFFKDAEVINKRERASFYAATDFGFDSFNWKTQWLYNRRESKSHAYRQFFPVIAAADSFYQPILPFPSDNDITVDYYFASTKLDGLFKATDSWGWEVNANYTRSDGDYSNLGIVTDRTGDLAYVDGTPPVDYTAPGFLNGERMGELADAIGQWHTGNTVYEQATMNALVSGDLFTLPAGAVSAAFGLEYRYYSIDDQPSDLSKQGQLWGSSSAQNTQGDDRVKEAFTEIEIPLLKGKPGFESLSVNLSGRVFEYDSVPGSDNVWKTGLNWQLVPWLRVRGSIGTSFRAPGLYELYLGDQTGFRGQLAIDPCIQWGESSNTFLQANCGAAGIPADYAGGGSSATVFSGGGQGSLVPETSKAKTLGIVFTPTFANINIAVDYFDYDIRDEITQLNEYDIVFGCYGSTVYPNAFCDQLERNSPTDPASPNTITTIYNKYVNINRQRARGYDVQFNYDDDFSFGKLSLDAQITYSLEDTYVLFSSAAEGGFSNEDQIGYIGRPKTVGIGNASLKRGDWTYSWQGQYTSSTQNRDLDPSFTYQGYENASRDIKAGWQLRHNVSVGYDSGDWGLLFGIRNVLDKNPALTSTGTATRYGNVPAFASQYDWYGRTYFVRMQYEF